MLYINHEVTAIFILYATIYSVVNIKYLTYRNMEMDVGRASMPTSLSLREKSGNKMNITTVTLTININ